MNQNEIRKLQRQLHTARLIIVIGILLTLTIIGAPIGIPMIFVGMFMCIEPQQKLAGGGALYFLIKPPEQK